MYLHQIVIGNQWWRFALKCTSLINFSTFQHFEYLMSTQAFSGTAFIRITSMARYLPIIFSEVLSKLDDENCRRKSGYKELPTDRPFFLVSLFLVYSVQQ
uniref:Uncharacterized protein n=1 Tax=Cacopsylla melanoneura TaxID=428564 RepID=A0A8D8LM73_9HEMI